MLSSWAAYFFYHYDITMTFLKILIVEFTGGWENKKKGFLSVHSLQKVLIGDLNSLFQGDF